ncbi:hypothetical protein [Nonomuraea glycinis]|uniref:hypothetical protein n=1 Tax=Nonomuraea glycinis TaxID=2047744 RepID=UPI0033A1758B
MTDFRILNASVARDGERGPVTLTFRRITRADPLTPYVSADSHSEDENSYKPGGLLNRSASLVIPGPHSYDEVIGQYVAAFTFTAVEDLDALVRHLVDDLRPRLTETIPLDVFADDDNTVTVDGQHLICPSCRTKDEIVARESAMRTTHLTINADGTIAAGTSTGTYDVDHYECAACSAWLYLPGDATATRS